MPDQPRDRGICGAAAPLLTPSLFGGHCDLLAGHTGWHEADGMHWGPRADAPNPVHRELAQADVDAAYQRGLAAATERWERLARAAKAWRDSDDLQQVGTDEVGMALVRAVDALPGGPWEPAPVTDAREASPSVDGGTSG